jgi:aminoglycoside phosphotransferase (APT) family kinase protein
MHYQPVDREPGAFQEPIEESLLEAICRRAFGEAVSVDAAVELGLGSYNNTYKVTIAGRRRPVVLRVAPREDRQFVSEWQFMRTEYASIPWLAVIAPLMPRTVAVDWSHEVIDRDWMIQTLLDGVPAPEGLASYPRPAWTSYYRRLGAIAKAVHGVRGPAFGPILGPGFPTWSEAVIASLADIATDLDRVGLDPADVRQAGMLAEGKRAVLDEIPEPRLMSGDLWNANVMVATTAPEPTITGVMDFDRTLWGDPAADWPIRLARSNRSGEREAFWDDDGYGPQLSTPVADWRSLVYEARHLGAVRLESYRSGDDTAIERTYQEMGDVLAGLT